MPREFNKLWLASGLANLGDGIARTAFPLLAALITRNPNQIAGLTVCFTLPWLFFSLHAGTIIDRLDRRQLMVRMGIARTFLLVSLSFLIAFDLVNLAWLYLIAFLFGTIEVFFDNASMTILPAVVSEEQLEQANSRLYAASLIGNGFAGLSLGGFLFAIFAALPFFVHSGILAFVVVLVTLLRGNFQPNAQNAKSTQTIGQDIREGLYWLRDNKILLNIAVLAGITNIAGTAAFSMLVLYALEILRIGETGYGLLLTAGTIGGLLGTLIAARLSKIIGTGHAILLSALIEASSYILMVLLSNVWVTAAALSLHAFAIVLWNVNAVSLRQSITPDHLLGRINSTYRLVGQGVTPLGALLGGVLASLFGLSTPFYAGGALILLSVVFVLPIINNKNIEKARAALALET